MLEAVALNASAAPLTSRERTWGAGLLLLLLAQLLFGVYSDGMVDDEPVYLGSGVRHLRGDFRINPEQPPVAKLIGAAPLQGMDLAYPAPRDGEDQCGWAHRFVNEMNPRAPLMRRGRLAVVAVTLGLAVLLWAWARAVAGPAAGLLALGLTAFQPALLAHGHLVTTDLPGAAALLCTSWLFWRFLEAPSHVRAAAVAFAFGIAILTRLTGLVLLPAFAILGLAAIVRAPPAERRRLASALGALAAIGVVFVPLLLWATYRFRYEPWAGEAAIFGPWPVGVAGTVLRFFAEHHLLPQAFLEGVRFQVEHSAEGHPGYLLGDRGRSGWWYYYAVALLVKNTPGFIALVAIAAVQTWRRRVAASAWHWLVPALLILGIASAGRIQIGERYIVAAYPYLILWIAAACAPLVRSLRGRIVVAAALILHIVPTLVAAPRGYLAFFNPLVGGTDRGHLFLADSNLDWGQDLPRLARWMRANDVRRVQLGYFGSDDPARYGIDHEDLPTTHSHHPVHPPAQPFTGTVVVSPNLLLGFLMRPGQNPYEFLLSREPDARAGVYFVYHLGR